MTVGKLLLAEDIEVFNCTGTPIDRGPVRELADGSFVADRRDVVVIGRIETGKAPRRFQNRA